MNKLIEFHRLSGIQPKEKKLVSLVNKIEKNVVSVLFTKHHVNLFLREAGDIYKIREDVIGGLEENEKIIVIV